jgi:hypothetical protein
MTDLAKGVLQASTQERPPFVLSPTETLYSLTHDDLIKLVADHLKCDCMKVRMSISCRPGPAVNNKSRPEVDRIDIIVKHTEG